MYFMVLMLKQLFNKIVIEYIDKKIIIEYKNVGKRKDSYVNQYYKILIQIK